MFATQIPIAGQIFRQKIIDPPFTDDGVPQMRLPPVIHL